MHTSLFEEQIFELVSQQEEEIEKLLDCNLITFYGQIVPEVTRPFIRIIEKFSQDAQYKKDTLSICLTTPGGHVESVEIMVRAIRHHYSRLNFIVAQQAMSAGTVFCMSGDKIYMDYSSSLGPIDPQILNKDGRFVPALGYIDKINELLQKAANGTLTQAEYALLASQDLAFLRLCEQARDLSTNLLQEWLVDYKFKDWVKHRTNNVGAPVTNEEKKARAKEIADVLADNKIWHTHGRLIGKETLKNTLKLEIDDFGSNPALHKSIRIYNDMLSDYFRRSNIEFALYNRHVIR